VIPSIPVSHATPSWPKFARKAAAACAEQLRSHAAEDVSARNRAESATHFCDQAGAEEEAARISWKTAVSEARDDAADRVQGSRARVGSEVLVVLLVGGDASRSRRQQLLAARRP
jgi:glycosyltransferase A (GT-A) superfamily protein (DUF2064 family)